MKLLIVTNHFWPENFLINDLAASLVDRGHEVTVLTGIPNYPEGRFPPGYGFFQNRVGNFAGAKVFRVPLIPRGNGRSFRLALNYLSYALSASIFAPFFCRERYDLIFVYETSPVTVGLPALVLKRLRSIPIMFWVQDLWPESLSATGAVKNRRILRLVDHLVRFIYDRCDKILVQSEAFVDSVRRHDVPLNKISYFPNSAEAIYRPVDVEPQAPERKLMPTGFCVAFAGNIGAAQDFPTVLAAAERLREYRDIHIVVLGDGRLRPWVEEEVRRRNLKNVSLLGRHPLKAMPRFFALADVLLVTLRKDPIFALTVPSKVQSYLACGKPIIAAIDGEGGRIVTEAGAGLSCPAEDPESLAQAILSMRQLSESARCRMGISGREYFEKHFERTMLMEKLHDWMIDLVSARNAECMEEKHVLEEKNV